MVISSGTTSTTLKFEDGSIQFRQRIVVSILSHRPLLIRNIRSEDIESPGLQEHEASFLRLIDRMTNGSNIEINSTGSQLRFKPGILLGGDIMHSCPTPDVVKDENVDINNGNPVVINRKKRSYSVGWFLEGILPLAPFGKEPLNLSLRGITDGTTQYDPSPDYIERSILPLMVMFGVGNDNEFGPPLALKVTKRGYQPLGGGEVHFTCPIIREIKDPLDMINPGMVKRVRGVVVNCKISPSSAARVAHSAKGLLHRLLPDVWIHTDSYSSRKSSGETNDMSTGGCGQSPGLSVCLAAESTTGTVIVAETCLDPSKHAKGALLPEDLGLKGAAMLLDEVRQGGCIDSGSQSVAFLLMCLGPEDVARIRIGSLSKYSIVTLRLLKEAFGVEFKIKADHESKTVILSCLGIGYRNMSRASS